MAVYHFTFHAYRSWMPDHRRGYTRDKQVLPSDGAMADRYRRRAAKPAVLFDEAQLRMMLSAAHDICRQRDWKLFVYASEPTHIHVVIGWKGYVDCLYVRGRVSNLLSTFLGMQAGQRGRRWFIRKPSRKRVRNRRHPAYLMDDYLPKHGGEFWRRDRDRDATPPPLARWLPNAPRSSDRGYH